MEGMGEAFRSDTDGDGVVTLFGGVVVDFEA